MEHDGYCRTARRAARDGALGGSSVLALLAAALAPAPGFAQQQQAVPGDARCVVAGTEVTCSGALPGGVNVPAADRDRYTRLTVRGVTGPIAAQAPDGVAIDVVNGSQPVTIVVDAPGTTITSVGATYPRGTFVVPSTSAIGVRAQTSGNISITSNATITIDADTIDYDALELVAGLAAETIQTGTGTRDVTLRNSGTITITSDQGRDQSTQRIAGLFAGYSGIAGIQPAPPRPTRIGTAVVENSGTITVERGAGIQTQELDFGTLDVLNSGRITASGPDGEFFVHGIAIEDGGRNQQVTVRNTGTITIEDVGASPIGIEVEKDLGGTGSGFGLIVNDGSIVQRNIESRDSGEGIRIGQRLSNTVGQGRSAGQPGATFTVINNGLIDVAVYGITVEASANRIVRNTGTIIIAAPENFGRGVEYNFNSPSGSNPTPYNPVGNATVFENSATGSIRVISTTPSTIEGNEPTGVQIFGGDPLITNAGAIVVQGDRARGIQARAAFQVFNGNGIPAIIGSVDATNSGRIEATGVAGIGFEVLRLYTSAADARDTMLVNSGTIAAAGAGAVGILHTVAVDVDVPPIDPAFANLGNATLALAATSVVRGGSGTGNAIRFQAGAVNRVTNAGLIAAESGTAILGGTGSEQIDNSGRIEGAVSLGAGNDRLVSRGGLVTGGFDGGAGDDILQVEVATGTIAFADRIGGAVSGVELFEKTGAGALSLTAVVAPRANLLGGTLTTNGALGAMAVTAAAGTTLQGAGALGAVTVADGATLAPGGGDVGTLRLASLGLANTSVLRFDLGAPGMTGGADNDLIAVTGNLTLDGRLDVAARPNFGAGVYRLIDYGGTLTDNGLVLGTAPAGDYMIQTAVAGQVNLTVAMDNLATQFWDGTDMVADGAIDGGAGTWSMAATNWTNSAGTRNTAFAGNLAVFQTPGGAVAIDPAGVSASGVQFASGGYTLGGGPLTLTGPATVRVGDGSAAGAGFSATVASPVVGTAGLTKTDLGTLILAGSNTYSGGTTIAGGVLQVSADGALGAAAGGVTLNAGTLRLAGVLSSARGFTIGAGGGTLDTGANAVTLSGALTGAGALARSGGGVLTYSGNGASYSGAFTLGGGTLALGGTLGGTLTVASGATLAGAGTLGNLVVAAGGVLAPGNSIGTLGATGNVTFRAGSFYDLELAAGGGTDLMRAAGTATIEGGTVRIATLDPQTQYVSGTRYTFLTAAGGRTGTFAGLSESSAFLDFALGYDATSAFATVAVIRTFPDVAVTFNQRQVSTGLAAFAQTAGSDSLAVYNTLLLLGTDPARAAFDASSGEIYASLLGASLRQGQLHADRLIARSSDASGEGLGVWGGVTGSEGDVDGDGNGARYTYDGIGGELGADYRGAGNRWAFGIGGGYGGGDLKLRDRASRAERDDWQIGGYARYGTNGAGPSVAASVVYARSDFDVTRGIALGTLARTATSDGETETVTLALSARYGIVAGNWIVGPIASLDHADADLARFAEHGAASLDLVSDGGQDRWTRYGGGLFANRQRQGGTVDVSVRYLTGARNLTGVPVRFAGAPTPFRINAARGSRDAAVATIGVDQALGGGWALGADARASIAGDERSFAGRAILNRRF